MSSTLFGRQLTERFHISKKRTNRGWNYEGLDWLASQDEDGNDNVEFVEDDD
jgi:hypothetical protein